MNNLTFSKERLDELLNEIYKDEIDLSLIFGTARHFYQITEGNALRDISLDAIHRLLEHEGLTVLVERISEGTEVWEFDRKKVLDLLTKNWNLFANLGGEKGSYVFHLIGNKNLRNIEKAHSSPIIFLKNPPASIL